MKIKDPNIRNVLNEHNFPENRGLNDYIDLFGFPLVNALKALKTRHHWLEAGAGEGRAIREFLLASSKIEIFTTAVTLKMSSAIQSPTHKTIVNYLEDLPRESIASCDIITDVTGGMQYTEQPDLLLKRYLLWLKPQALLFLYVKPDTTFVERDGKQLSFREWIHTISGLVFTEGSNPDALIISKENAGHPIPRLKLVETRLAESLIRQFKEM